MARRDRWDRKPEDKFVSGVYLFFDYIKRNRALFTVALVVVFGGLLGALAYWNHVRSYNENAMAAFESAKTDEDYRRVIKSYPGSAAEPMAMFYRGRKLLDDKKYPEAAGVFSGFLMAYPDYPLAPNALLLMGMILEQQKKYREAIGSYDSLVERYPGSFVAPLALLNAGGCYERLDETADAKKEYERIISDYPASNYKQQAEERESRLGATKESWPAPRHS